MSGTTPFDCPRCGAMLTMSERQGIEIDYCPQCRGVWLDRGELDKIIERADAVRPPPPAVPSPPAYGAPAGGWTRPAPQQQQSWRQSGRDGDDDRRDDHHGKKRKGWLGELFD